MYNSHRKSQESPQPLFTGAWFPPHCNLDPVPVVASRPDGSRELTKLRCF